MKNSLAIEILKLFAWIFCAWIFWVFIFSVFTPSSVEEVVEPFNGASLVFGFLTGVIITFVLKLNNVSSLKQKANAVKSNVEVLNKRSETLLTKANKVADKYMNHESHVQKSVAYARKGKVILNSKQFGGMLENYPELKANESIMELLKQIRESENVIANEKMTYNDYVSLYNTLIHSFPLTLISFITRFKDLEFYSEEDSSGIPSDEELGI